MEDKDWSDDVTLFDVSDIKNYFKLGFEDREKIKEHINYYISLEKSSF